MAGTKLSKLRNLHTHHDRYFLHKTLGFLAVSHFCYRVVRVVVTGETGFAELTAPWLVAIIALHAVLAGTGNLFKVLTKPLDGQIIIFRETQLHSGVFTLRSLLIFTLCAVWPHTSAGNPTWVFARMAILGCSHALADAVTAHFGRHGKSLIRDIPLPKGLSPWQQWGLRTFYSTAQLSGIARMLGAASSGMDASFFVLFPVQLSAFLATLVRKGLITPNQWHAVYAISILLALICIGTTYQGVGGRLAFIAVVVARLRFSVNKYVMWAVYAALMCF